MSAQSASIYDYIALMRPYQYSKNLLVFAPAFFGFGQYVFADSILPLCVVFCLFSLMASGIYVINDVIDAPRDKLHPHKSSRPIASGRISRESGIIFGIVLLVFAGGGCYFAYT